MTGLSMRPNPGIVYLNIDLSSYNHELRLISVRNAYMTEEFTSYCNDWVLELFDNWKTGEKKSFWKIVIMNRHQLCVCVCVSVCVISSNNL